VRLRNLLCITFVALLVAASCAQSASEIGRGFAVSGDDLRNPPPVTEPPEDWTVEVATAKPEVAVVEAFREPPQDSGVTQVPPDPSTLPGAHLSPIPGTTPNVGSAQILGGWSFNNPTYFGNPLVFLVTEKHGPWLKVMVPTRPNQQEGWIPADKVDLSTTEWHAEINVTNNSLKVWNGEELVADTSIIDGKASSPTPLGRFYFNEKIERSPTSAYGSWIFSTNAYSDSLEVFDDGLPVFAVHGTNNPAQIPSDISNGCVRVPNEVIEMMAAQVPMGTPIVVVA
jgi:lipoprotein-anchoring transpeptidase ErfK/SrfK